MVLSNSKHINAIPSNSATKRTSLTNISQNWITLYLEEEIFKVTERVWITISKVYFIITVEKLVIPL